jgi:hypothetical protein
MTLRCMTFTAVLLACLQEAEIVLCKFKFT